MATYSIEPTPGAIHGPFSRERAPILTIDSGDTVRFQTLDAGWGLEPNHQDGSPRRLFEPRERGHALAGPVAIRGAEPGMTLEIQIDRLRLGTFGYTNAGGWSSPVNEHLGITDKVTRTTLNWELDPDRLVGRDQFGHQLPLRPFLGVMGMPPDEPGEHSTAPPRPTGGNIDCKELVAGSSLFLPIAVPGGLFSTGDGHALQGDGEVSTTAIECPMELAELTFILHDDLHLSMLRANTPPGWITFGFDTDLNQAMLTALAGVIELMSEQYCLAKTEAVALASLVVDLHVTQVVNQVSGVHAILPHGALDHGSFGQVGQPAS